MSTTLKIQKKLIPSLAAWLNDQALFGSESRHRTRFVALLTEELKNIEDERKEIVGRFVEKEEDGKTWKKTVDNGVESWSVPADKKAEMEKEYNEMMDEEFIVEVGEGNKSKIKTARDIVLNTKYEFGPKEGDTIEVKVQKIRLANEYEKWCEAFEVLDIQ